MTKITQLRKKGQFTIPSEMREKMQIKENDMLSVCMWGKALIVIPERLKTMELLKKTNKMARKKGISPTKMLAELEKTRYKES